MGGIIMKQFSLEEYHKNPSRKIVTRDGRKVRIKCTDRRSAYPIIGLVTTRDDTTEDIIAYTRDGEYLLGVSSTYDLFFFPEKHEGWINVYRDTDTGTTSFGATLYASREEAEEVGKSDDYYTATAKIEWEE